MTEARPGIRHRLSVSDYQRMGAAGIPGDDCRTELIDGELFEMAPIGTDHAWAVRTLINLLAPAAAGKALLDAQNPPVLGGHSQPQPDLLLLRPRPDGYRSALPRPEDVWLLIEVADSSLRFDREVKVPLYARHGIAEVWLFDLAQRCLEIHRDPQPAYGDYRTVERRHGGTVVCQGLPGIEVDLGKVFH